MHADRTTAVHARIPTPEGQFRLHHYSKIEDGKEHMALVYGNMDTKHDILVRVHSECFTGDVLGSLRCDCGPQLQMAMAMIAQAGSGVIIYLRQEGRGIGLAEKLRAYNLQDQGYDTVEANLVLGHQADERRYEPAASILNELGVSSIRLLTNNPEKIEGLTALGIAVSQRIPIETGTNAENSGYLQTKVTRMRHMLSLANGHQPLSSERTIDTPSKTTSHQYPSITGFPAADCQIHLLRQQIVQHQHASQPFVTLSYAQSLDGSLAAERCRPSAISGTESMTVTHAIRTSHDAILVGVETILSDNPQLNVRLVPGNSPIPIVLDSHLRTPPTARIFDAHPEVIIATTRDVTGTDASEQAYRTKKKALQNRGALVLHVPEDALHRVSLFHLLHALREQNIFSLMVEGGSSVLTSFLVSHLVDYLAVTIAPTYIGGLNVLEDHRSGNGRAMGSAPIHRGAAIDRPLPKLENPAWTPVGADLILWGQLCAKA